MWARRRPKRRCCCAGCCSRSGCVRIRCALLRRRPPSATRRARPGSSYDAFWPMSRAWTSRACIWWLAPGRYRRCPPPPARRHRWRRWHRSTPGRPTAAHVTRRWRPTRSHGAFVTCSWRAPTGPPWRSCRRWRKRCRPARHTPRRRGRCRPRCNGSICSAAPVMATAMAGAATATVRPFCRCARTCFISRWPVCGPAPIPAARRRRARRWRSRTGASGKSICSRAHTAPAAARCTSW